MMLLYIITVCIYSILLQWMDFTDATQFSESCTKLMEAVHTLIGVGSGPEM